MLKFRIGLINELFPLFPPLSTDVCKAPLFPNGGLAQGVLPAGLQYILTSANFSGCGEVVNWRMRGIGKGNSGAQERPLEIQLFRPSKVQPGVFSKISSTAVTATRLQLDWVTSVTVSLGFTFSPGDVLGVYHPNPDNYLGLYYQTSRDSQVLVTSLVNAPTSDIVTITGAAEMTVPIGVTLSSELFYIPPEHHCCL